MDAAFDEIFDHVKDLEIIDTHEHLPYCENARDKKTDVLREYFLSQYFNSDLISAGLKKADFNKANDTELPVLERWKLIEPYWEFARNTGYGRALEISAKELYGIDNICSSTIEQLNESFLHSLKSGHFNKVIKEKSKIKICLLDDNDKVNLLNYNVDCDKNFFRNVCCVDNLIFPVTEDHIRQVAEKSKIRICSFDDWLEACEILLDEALKSGIAVFKSRLAYVRTLNYEKATKAEAELHFNEIFKLRHFPPWYNRITIFNKKYQDYMMHFILRIANKNNLTFQFHAGIQEGNGNLIYNSEPSLLSNLFLEYPDVDFDIFHIAYPYQQVLSVLAKNFPNVFIDMCWAHIISPSACVNALVEWMDSVPINKISAFGGDYIFVDGIYGHQYMARMNVSKALSIKVKEGIFDIGRAKEISEMLFYKNPFRIFKLENRI